VKKECSRSLLCVLLQVEPDPHRYDNMATVVSFQYYIMGITFRPKLQETRLSRLGKSCMRHSC